jgi:hypothetical protein
MTPRGDQIVDGYLARLEIALFDLPPARRAEIVAEVGARIARSRASAAEEGDIEVFRLLDDIGDPAALAAQAAAGLPARPRGGWREALAIAGLVSIWPVGVALLWWSRVWPTRVKLIGTLVPPGGYLSLVLASSALALWTATLPPVEMQLAGVLLLLTYDVWLVLPVTTAVYLATMAWRRARRSVLVPAIAGPVAVLLVGVSVIPVVISRPESSALPDLTTSQFTDKFASEGCDGPVELGGIWISVCKAKSGSIAAYGSDDHTVGTVVATFVRQRGNPLAPQPDQLFDAVVRGVCRPAAAGQVRAWVDDHLGGGQTDIDGYRLGIVDLGGDVTLSIVASARAQGTAGAPQTAPPPALLPPGAAVSGQAAIPNITTSDFRARLGAGGFSCNQPADLAGVWVTGCTEASNVVAAYGPDDHTIGEVIVFPSLRQQPTPEQTIQLFATVIDAVCTPTDAGQIEGWALDHLGGGQTDIDGYRLGIAPLGGAASLSISRSRP